MTDGWIYSTIFTPTACPVMSAHAAEHWPAHLREFKDQRLLV